MFFQKTARLVIKMLVLGYTVWARETPAVSFAGCLQALVLII